MRLSCARKAEATRICCKRDIPLRKLVIRASAHALIAVTTWQRSESSPPEMYSMTRKSSLCSGSSTT
eukprot:5025891-Pleurochrysis_carterae.AAC.2